MLSALGEVPSVFNMTWWAVALVNDLQAVVLRIVVLVLVDARVTLWVMAPILLAGALAYGLRSRLDQARARSRAATARMIPSSWVTLPPAERIHRA